MHCCLMMKLFTGSMTGAGSKGKGRVWVEKDLTSTDICFGRGVRDSGISSKIFTFLSL